MTDTGAGSGAAGPAAADLTIRHAEPSDHARVLAVVDAWWGGRPMAAMLPRLFFVHFRPTSFVLEQDGRLAGFLCGFVSQTDPAQAYVHFVGVDPGLRGRGAGRLLYERFFVAAREHGCTVVHAVTSPVNRGSVAFHTALGFTVREGGGQGYDGPGEDRVRFTLSLLSGAPARTGPGDGEPFRPPGASSTRAGPRGTVRSDGR